MKKLLSLVIVCFIALQVNAQQAGPVTSDQNAQIKEQENSKSETLQRKRNITRFDDRLIIGPNPVNEGVLFIRFSNPADVNARFTIIDSWGNLMLTRNIINPTSNTMEIDVSFLASGTYYGTLTTATYTVTKAFIVIQ